MLSEFPLNIPNRQLRQSKILRPGKTSANYAMYFPHNRITSSVNVHPSLEYFGSSLNNFKTTILKQHSFIL